MSKQPPLETPAGSLTFNKIGRDRHDYNALVAASGLTHQEVQAFVQNEADRVDLDLAQYEVELRESPIHGLGMFATSGFLADERVMAARIGKLRTQAGRYVNHSADPNCAMSWENLDTIVMRTTRRIEAGEELTVDYRDNERLAFVRQNSAQFQRLGAL